MIVANSCMSSGILWSQLHAAALKFLLTGDSSHSDVATLHSMPWRILRDFGGIAPIGAKPWATMALLSSALKAANVGDQSGGNVYTAAPKFVAVHLCQLLVSSSPTLSILCATVQRKIYKK